MYIYLRSTQKELSGEKVCKHKEFDYVLGKHNVIFVTNYIKTVFWAVSNMSPKTIKISPERPWCKAPEKRHMCPGLRGNLHDSRKNQFCIYANPDIKTHIRYLERKCITDNVSNRLNTIWFATMQELELYVHHKHNQNQCLQEIKYFLLCMWLYIRLSTHFKT